MFLFCDGQVMVEAKRKRYEGFFSARAKLAMGFKRALLRFSSTNNRLRDANGDALHWNGTIDSVGLVVSSTAELGTVGRAIIALFARFFDHGRRGSVS